MATTALIGKLQPDNTVTFIRLQFDGYYSHAGRILQTFYSREHRVDALLDLGNLHVIAPSPFNPCDDSGQDDINCRAYIRDIGHKPKDNKAEKGMSPEIFQTLDRYVYLFRDGKWCVPVDGEYRDIKTVSRYGAIDRPDQRDSLSGLTIYRMVSSRDYPDNRAILRQIEHFGSWDALCRFSENEKTACFVFRGTKLVSVINRHYHYQPTNNRPHEQN